MAGFDPVDLRVSGRRQITFTLASRCRPAFPEPLQYRREDLHGYSQKISRCRSGYCRRRHAAFCLEAFSGRGAEYRADAESTPTRYRAGTAERSLDIINLYDLEAEARKLIPVPQFGYISSGSGDEWTLKENIRAFDDRQILPRYLAGVEQPDTSTELPGSKVGTPIFIPPMAAHGLAHVNAERATARCAA